MQAALGIRYVLGRAAVYRLLAWELEIPGKDYRTQLGRQGLDGKQLLVERCASAGQDWVETRADLTTGLEPRVYEIGRRQQNQSAQRPAGPSPQAGGQGVQCSRRAAASSIVLSAHRSAC